ncbi:hypothetical protein UFOVP266_47 [uncultured Caudovirales phage]|uniref:Uncharacterized protein n=1 Tax=uncultured Caudovirales phage TaxID=2100421 RepID=A0A6J5LRM1_9CAUD|nr:hypothetical protein UFOVP266_47 [uncultured Caudovirales phage]
MADLTEVYAALKKAHEAGDTEAAQKLADYIRSQPAQTEAPAATEGMPAPRVTNYGLTEKTLAVPQEKGQPLFTYDPAEALKAAGRGAAYSALTLGGLGDISGGGVGATTKEVKEATGFEETPPEYVPFEIAGGLVGPGLISRGVNVAQRGINATRDLVSQYAGMPYNKLLEALGPDAPAVLNALRANKTGVETGGQAAAGVGNVEFSRFAKGYEDKAPQIYSDVADRQKALIEAQAKRVEETAAKGEKAVAADVAAPSQTDVGNKITDIAREERDKVKREIIRPAYKAAFDAAGDAKIDASGVVADAEKILGTPLADIPRKDMPATAEALASLESAGPRLIVGPNNAPIAPKVQATLEQLDKVRKAVNVDIAAASTARDPAAATRLYNLRNLHDSIDAAVQNSSALDDMQKSLYKNAVERYRADYAPRFKTGEASKIFEKRMRNEPGIKPEDVASSFLKGESEAQSFIDLFKGNKDALDEAKKGIEGIYRKEVIKTGDTIDPTAHANFMLKYGPQIDILDTAGMGLRDRFTSLVGKTASTTPAKETAAALKTGEKLPEGAKAAQITGEVNDIIKTLKPDDVDTIAQIAARNKRYEEISTPSTKPESGGFKYNPLQLSRRVAADIYDALSQRLGNKTATRIAELLSTPEGTQAFIEMAQKTTAAREARKAAAERAFQSRNALATQMGVTGAISNALAAQ